MISNKKILITGAAGFIGANLAHYLAKTDNQLVLFLREKSVNDWRIKALCKQKNVRMVRGNIEKKGTLKFIQKLQPDVIIHNAIHGGYGFQQKFKKRVINTNFLGTVNLLEEVKNIDFDCFILTGSSSEYGIKNKPMSEKDTLEPAGAYGVSKAAASLYASYIARETGKKIIIARPFSVFGDYEEKTRLIPYIVTQYLRHQKTLHLRTPHAPRDYLFIADLMDFYCKIISSPSLFKPGEVVNLGSGTETRVVDLVNVCKRVLHHDFEICLSSGTDREGDVFKKWRSDTSRIRERFNWQPKHSLEQGIIKTVAWFRKNLRFYV
ncbi:MAG: NAD(P)-dependent oxidoreductase [Deltaproteobacteria bacterium]|nr:NAD(P)-dependent oxidoreductase [Deltaproteobacteria bacterium]